MPRMWRALGTAIVFLGLAVPLRAESIQITSGSLIWLRGAPADVTLGGEGFSFDGAGLNGLFMPGFQCGLPECLPGTTIDLSAVYVGLDLPGSATLNGTTYTGVGGLVASSSMATEWTGSLSIPVDFTGGVLSTPFNFTGAFFVNDLSSTPVTNLFGTGTASLTFTPNLFFPGTFNLTLAEYEFDGTAPVPEPASMVLIGTGLAGLAAMRRRRTEEVGR